MSLLLFFRFVSKENGFEIAVSSGKNVREAYSNAQFSLFQINEVYIMLMQTYDIIDQIMINSQNAIKYVNKAKRDYLKAIEPLQSYNKDNNMVLDFIITKLLLNLEITRKSGDENILKNVFTGGLRKQEQELRLIQEDLLNYKDNNSNIICIDEDKVKLTSDVVIDGITQYYNNDAICYNVLDSSIKPLILKLAEVISFYQLDTGVCIVCGKYFIRQKKNSKKTCCIECSRMHEVNRKKNTLQNDQLQFEYTIFSKDWNYRNNKITDSNLPIENKMTFLSLMESQREQLKKVKNRVKYGDISYTSFEECLDVLIKTRDNLYTKFKEEIKNGQYKKEK